MHLRPVRQLRPVRLALHVVAVTVLAGSGLLLTGAPGQAAEVARPDSYGGDTASSAVHFLADRNPQPTPVTDLIHAELPYATTSFDSSGNATARSASIYPGAGLLGVPGLLCQAGACLPVPDYPFLADASYPTMKDASATTSQATIHAGPLSIAPHQITAHADPDRVEALSEASGVGVNGVVSIDSTTAHSKQVFQGSTLVVSAETVLNGVDLGAGQLHIDQIRTVATAQVDGAKVSGSAATTTVSGATVAGTPVTIDSHGISVAGKGDGGQLNGAANTALAALDAAGIQVRLLVPTKSAKTGVVAAASGGLLVTFKQAVNLPPPPALPPRVPVPPSPNGDYVGSATLAGAGVTAFATPQTLLDTPTLGTPPVPPVQGGAPALGGAPIQAAVGSAQGPLTSDGPVSGAAAPRTAPAQDGVAAPATRAAAVLGIDLSGKRMRVLALVLLGYPLLVLLAAPLRAPSRLPRLG